MATLKILLRCAAALVLAFPTLGFAGTPREFPIGSLGSLRVELEEGWQAGRAPPNSGAAVSIQSARPGTLQILLTPVSARRPDAEVRKLVQQAAEKSGPRSVEKTPVVEELRGKDAFGYYFRATDAAPRQGEYRYRYQGIANVSASLVTFTVLYRDGAEKDAAAAIESIRGMSIQPPIPSTEAGKRLSLAAGTRPLVLPGAGWIMGDEERIGNGRAVHYVLSNDAQELNFSVYIDRTAECRSAAACLRTALQNPDYRARRDPVEATEGPFALTTFYLDRPSGMPIQQANVLASAYVDGIWYDVNISKGAAARPAMQPLVDLLKRLAIAAPD